MPSASGQLDLRKTGCSSQFNGHPHADQETEIGDGRNDEGFNRRLISAWPADGNQAEESEQQAFPEEEKENQMISKHRAIDQYLVSLGIDPHKDVKMMNELPEQQK